MADFKDILLRSTRFSIEEKVVNVKNKKGNYKNVTLKVFNEATKGLIFLAASDSRSKSIIKAVEEVYINTCKKMLSRASRFDALKNYLDLPSYVFTYEFAIKNPDLINLITELTNDKGFNSIKTQVYILMPTSVDKGDSSIHPSLNSPVVKLLKYSAYDSLDDNQLEDLIVNKEDIIKPVKYFGKDNKIKLVINDGKH